MIECDAEEVNLPQELEYLLAGALSSQRHLYLKVVLDSVPRFAELPQRAPEKNYRKAGSGRSDRQLKAWQQQVLHSLRFLAAIYVQYTSGGDQNLVVNQLQQLWQLLAEFYHKVEDARKEASLPGTTIKS